MSDEFQMSSIVSMMPRALLDKEKSLLILRQSRLSEWRRPIICLYDKLNMECEQLFQLHSEQKRTLQANIKQLSLDTERIKKEVYGKELERNVIRNQIMAQKQILENTVKHVPDEEELSELAEKVCTLKHDIGKKQSDLKIEMEKFKKGIYLYNKYLHCTIIVISKDTVLFTFDTSAKSVSEAKEYLKFYTEDNGKTFQFLEMRPKLKTEQQLVKIYNETGDIQGFIVSFWKVIKGTNSRKVLGEKN